MWEWMVSQGLIKGESDYYASGKATAAEMDNAIQKAYLASSGDIRKQLVDKLYATGKFEGSKEYWYQNRDAEVSSLGKAAQALAPPTGAEGLTKIDGPDYTEGAEETRFNGLPGKPEIWLEKETGKVYAVYYVPNSSPPIPLLYHVPNEDDLKSLFGDQDIAYDREIGVKDIDSFGSIRWGTTNDIPASGGDPWLGFVERMDRAVETQPWLADPEVFATFTAAWLEGREPEQWELESTEFWQDSTEAQREWMWLKARNPAESDTYLTDNIIKTQNAFTALGMSDVNDQLVKYMADQFSMGNWSQTRLSNQIQALFDPTMQDQIDGGLSKFITDNSIEIGTPAGGISDVRAQWTKWLGPAFPPTDAQIAEWSTKLRTGGAGAKDQLSEYLRSQRIAMYPEYDNPDLTYQDIAGPWRGFATNVWGQQMDESSNVFQQLIKMNDSVEGGKLLRKEGMKQGIGQVQAASMTGLMDQTSTVRRAI